MKLRTLFSTFREFIAWRTEAVSAMQQMKTGYVVQYHIVTTTNQLYMGISKQ